MGTKQYKENSPYSWKSREEEQETQPAVVREDFPEEMISKLRSENEQASSRRRLAEAHGVEHIDEFKEAQQTMQHGSTQFLLRTKC